MPFCQQCGHSLEETARFCSSCGKDQGAAFSITHAHYAPVSQPVPKCPTCGSPHIQKISLTNKAGSIVGFGVFSIGHVSKTFKCTKCGYKW